MATAMDMATVTATVTAMATAMATAMDMDIIPMINRIKRNRL